MWTAGSVCWVIDAMNKLGIMQEIAQRLDARRARYGRGRDYAIDPEAMKLVLEQLCAEAGVQVQLHTRCVAALKSEENRLTCAITESSSGRQAWLARAFVDATGNGDLAAQAGCAFDVGREDNGEMQPMSLLALVAGFDPEEARAYCCWPDEDHRAAKATMLREMERAGLEPSYGAPTFFHLGGRLYVLSTNHEYGLSGLDADDITRGTLHARGEVNALVDGLRGLGGIWRDIRLVSTASHIGIRDGRRIRGVYQVTRDDLLGGVSHDDAVCRVTVGIDVHTTDPARNRTYSAENRTRTLPYDIPLRALIARDVDGLVLAGRCISGDFVAHASYRMTGTATALGQAAGALAAVAAQEGCAPRELSWSRVRHALASNAGVALVVGQG